MSEKTDLRISRIHQKAVETKNKYHGYRGTAVAYGKLTVQELREYADDILFLCKELEKAKTVGKKKVGNKIHDHLLKGAEHE